MDLTPCPFYMTQAQAVRRAVALYYRTDEAALYSKSRKQPLSDARHVAMYLIYRLVPSMTLEAIARHLGRTDHSTTLHAIRKVQDRLETDKAMQRDVTTLWNLIQNN